MRDGCRTCRSLAGERISPAAPIFGGEFWAIELAPSALVGWLVLVLKRHAVGVHEMTAGEFAELSRLLEPTIRLLHDVFDTEKEYVMLLAEGEGFRHVHVHVVPVTDDLPREHRGVRVFHYLKPETEPLPPDEVRALGNDLARRFALLATDVEARPQRIFHIATSRDWETRRNAYSRESLADDGFIHCATAAQVLRVGDALFEGRDDLVLVSIDTAAVQDCLVYEDCYETGEQYPHIYGPLPGQAIRAVYPFRPEADGTFALPDGVGLVGS